MKQESKTVLLQYVSLVTISILSGLLIALIQVAAKYLFVGVENVYEGSYETVTPLVFYSIACVLIVFGFYIFSTQLKLNLANSTNVLIRYLSKDKVKLYEYPLLLLGFFVSLFAGLPVGGVEICQIAGVGLASEAYKRTSIKDNDSFDLASSASFGAAFMSPLAGLLYGLESRKWKVSIAFVLKLLLAILITVGTCYLIKIPFGMQNSFIFRLTNIDKFSWNSLWLYAFLGVVIGASAFIINLSSLKFNDFLSRRKKWEKLRTIFTFSILVVALVCTFFGFKDQWEYFYLAGFDGSRLIYNSARFSKVGLLIVTLLLWAIYVLLIPHSRLVGGKIIPLMTLGGLIGICFVFFGKNKNIITTNEHFLMITTAMFALFGVTYKKPATAVALALTFTTWSVMPYQLPILVLSIAPGYLLMLITKTPSLNECLGLSDSLNIEE